jgi:hypothetical protein
MRTPCLLISLLISAPAGANPALQRLQSALLSDDAEVTVTWEIGPPSGPRAQLRIEGGRAQLRDCPPGGACTEVAAQRPLTAGQKARLLSGLRAAGLPTLRSAGPESGTPDRSLAVALAGAQAGTWRLPRADWPAPPGGDTEGLAAFLDELADGLRRQATARRPLPVPRSAAELARIQLKVRLLPRERPGGVLSLVHGVASITPEEGTQPRTPRPTPWQRKLSEAEQEALAQALAAADLDRLEEQVPRREAPAIGDSDGRLLTLHLLPLLDEGEAAGQPRGLQRYLADLLRSPARPLFDRLLALLLEPPARPQPPPRTAMEVVGRDDLVLRWEAAGAAPVTVRMADLQEQPREALRKAVIVAGPYLAGRPRTGERVLVVMAPVREKDKTRDHVVGTYGGSLASWRRGATSYLADILEKQGGR